MSLLTCKSQRYVSRRCAAPYVGNCMYRLFAFPMDILRLPVFKIIITLPSTYVLGYVYSKLGQLFWHSPYRSYGKGSRFISCGFRIGLFYNFDTLRCWTPWVFFSPMFIYTKSISAPESNGLMGNKLIVVILFVWNHIDFIFIVYSCIDNSKINIKTLLCALFGNV